MRFLCVVVFLVAVSGCTTARFYATGGNNVSLTCRTNVAGAGSQQFKIHKRYCFDYTKSVDVQEIVRDKLGAGYSLENASLTMKWGFVDLLLDLVTLGFANSYYVQITGDAIPPEGKNAPAPSK